MHSGVEVDGVDFRPFFDMVVGILFVLLILIGALLFFQQSSQDEAAIKEAERNARVLEVKITQFLEMMASDLRQHGFEATVDLPNKSVAMPLQGLAELGPDRLPQVVPKRVEDFGRVLATDLPCLVDASPANQICAPFEGVRMNMATVQIQAGAAGPNALLPQAQSVRLLTSEFSTVLFRNVPALLGLFNAAGYAAVETAGRSSAATLAPSDTLGGQVEVRIEFAPP